MFRSRKVSSGGNLRLSRINLFQLFRPIDVFPVLRAIAVAVVDSLFFSINALPSVQTLHILFEVLDLSRLCCGGSKGERIDTPSTVIVGGAHNELS